MIRKIGVLTVLLLVAVLILAACAAPAPGETYKGKTATIVLEENPTTGYTWAVSVDNPSVISLKSDKYFEEDTGRVGSGGVHQYVFEAMSPGTATITFELGQQWDGGEKGAETKIYKVTVGDDGNIFSIEAA